MKKIFLLLAVFSMVFTSCDPLEDINEQIDAEGPAAVVGDATYTMTDEDYESLELDDSYFEDNDIAKSMIPGFLMNKYPAWGKKSSVLLSYELKNGTDLEIVTDYTSATSYNLANADYPSAGDNATGFYETEEASDYIPAILTTNIASPEKGDVALVGYSQYVGETVNGITEIFSKDFVNAGTLLDFEAISVSGDQVWAGTNYGAKMTGFVYPDAIANEDWLVSSEIDLTSFTNAKFQVNQIFNKGDYNSVSILISSDYTDDVATATWEEINLTNVPDGTSWTAVESEEYSLSAYDGKKVHIAFKYTSTDSSAGTYEIVKATIKAPGVEGVSVDKDIYYTFDGSDWGISEGVYYLSKEDYDIMGENSGQPGKYNNFSSSINPNTYISTFLKNKYTYAQEGDDLLVFFKYFSESTTSVRGNEFTFTNGEWVAHETKFQFGHDGSVWVPDNTIKYTLIRNDDYAYIASQLTEPEYASLIGNLASYGDFDYNWDKKVQIPYALSFLLPHIAPNAEEGQKYTLTYVIYDNGENDYQTSFIKTDGVWVLND
ncbi:DUF5017 domain-containing protein [Polaribacter sp. Z014]|uniref:choice-of-anchor J domain-containing protein n=1 Tax=unclassified Polaribacter TaxID=196858 RepID=UPI00193C4ACA|nr:MULTISPECIES: choice-of-anchor J domain-containing protein [unclassified Polaribacter]MCL7762296.1 DUF5017 domain-containing protein [Polaribacter sp. Z014]QVY64281.1 choice-of-anchor J domain-containing protein [Polaribacter sp. Q13]